MTHDADDDVPKLLEIPLARKSDKKMTYRWMKNRADSKLFEKILSDTNDKEKSLENRLEEVAQRVSLVRRLSFGFDHAIKSKNLMKYTNYHLPYFLV